MEPTALSSWRLAVLMGVNTRTYKFALGAALLQAAAEGRDALTLEELAAPYAMSLARRASAHPQAPTATSTGTGDFLAVVADESRESLDAGRPTERLVAAAARNMPGIVMQKFHNLRDADANRVGHTCYELRGRGSGRRVVLTPDLRAVAHSAAALGSELDARWSVVECSFDAGIGRSLVRDGVAVSPDATELRSHVRRAPVAPARYALSGFQHGRCFYCGTVLPSLDEGVHVDHVYPYSTMRRLGAWAGPDLNGIWNLVVACAPCNLRKSARTPTSDEIERLVARNEAVISSPHPLRRTLGLTMRAPGDPEADTPARRLAFLRSVHLAATAATPL